MLLHQDLEGALVDGRLKVLVVPGPKKKKSGNVFRVGIYFDFFSPSARTPQGADVQMGGRNRIDRHRGGIERLGTRTRGHGGEVGPREVRKLLPVERGPPVRRRPWNEKER